MAPPSGRRSGVVLVMVSCLLMLLLVLGVSLLEAARPAASAAFGRAASARAGLAAASGTEYAAARLSEEPEPRLGGSAAARGDDWTCRQGADNPSYSHGESWLDDGDGRRAGGEPFAERDGDRRFGAWTGRVRGGKRAFALRFSLKIESAGAGIPVNAGVLGPGGPDGLDNDGDGATDEPDEADRNANGVPDHRDAGLRFHRGLEHVLNNLGAIVLPAGGTGRRSAPCGTAWEVVECSFLGTDLVADRPAGGYASMGDVDVALARRGYAAGERAAVLRFLSADAPASISSGARPADGDPAVAVPNVPVELLAAPSEVLQSFWRYLSCRTFQLPAEPDAMALPYPRAGGSAVRYGSGAGPNLVLFPDEALLLAGEVIALRAAGRVSWRSLHRHLAERGEAVFAADLGPLAAHPIAARSWARAKADLAFWALSLDPPPPPMSSAWGSGGIDLDASTLATEPFSCLWMHRLARAPYPEAWDPDGAGPVPPDPYAVFRPSAVAIWLPPFTLAPPVLARVESIAEERAGGSTTRGSDGPWSLRFADRMELSSQEDFERLSGGKDLDPFGVSLGGLPPEQYRQAFADAVPDLSSPPASTVRSYPHLVSLPRWNARSRTGWRFSRTQGALALAARETARQGSRRYWPFSEDFDRNAATDLPSEPAGARFPATGLCDDLYGCTPWWTQGSGCFFLCPWRAGIDPDGIEETVDAVSIEAHMACVGDGARSGLTLWSFPMGEPDQETADFLGLTAQRWCDPATGRVGTLLSLEWRWKPVGSGFNDWQTKLEPDAPQTAFLPDVDPATGGIRRGESRHVILTIRSDYASRSMRIRLFADGKPLAWQDGEAELSVPALAPDRWQLSAGHGSSQYLEVFGMDEIRIYDRILDEEEALARHRLGRHVKRGLYRSPVYRLGGGARLRRAQWTAVSCPEIDARVKVDVSVFPVDAQGFDLGPMRILDDPAGRFDLSALPPCAGLRYEVAFTDRGSPDPLFETPVFESIWLSFERPGRTRLMRLSR